MRRIAPRWGLQHQQPGHHGSEQQDGLQRRPGVLDPPVGAGQQVGREDHEGDLGQLRRLEHDGAHAEPPPGPVGAQAHAGHGGQRQQQQRHAQADRCEPPPMVVVDAEQHEQGRQADTQPHGLALEQRPGRVGSRQARGGRGRQRHHQAQHHQSDHGQEQHEEQPGAPAHRGPGAAPVRGDSGRGVAGPGIDERLPAGAGAHGHDHCGAPWSWTGRALALTTRAKWSPLAA